MTVSECQAEIDHLVAAYHKGLLEIGATPEKLLGWWSLGLYTPSPGVEAAWHGMKVIGDELDRWKTEHLAWAQAGVKSTGRPYTWSDWLAEENELGADIEYQTGSAWDGSIAGVVTGTVTQTASDVAKGAKDVANTVTHPLAWPAWAWGVVLIGGLWLLRPYASAAGALKGS